jgi:hypothetical protein
MLYKCICWLIIKVILRNARCNNKGNLYLFFHSACISCISFFFTCSLSYLINSLPFLPKGDKHFRVDVILVGTQLLGSEESVTSIFRLEGMTLFPLSRRRDCTELPGVSFQENVIILCSPMITYDFQT